MKRSRGGTVFLIGFVLGCLLVFSEVFGIVGYAVAIALLPLVAMTVAFFAGPLAWYTLFLVVPMAAAVNGLIVGTVFWGVYKLIRLINK